MFKICIDAGHGGNDPGAIGYSGVKEKDITLAIAKNIKKALQPFCEIIMTREKDITPERVKIANQLESDYLVSIHCNSGPLTAAGREIFHWDNSKEGQLLAENIDITLDEIEDIKNRGIKLASELRKTRGWDRGPSILQDTEMPAVIVEIGFITNQQEELFLTEASNQWFISKCISKGILNYLFGKVNV
ncbi:MAG: N-acetylmuramoyl-L-alanine amidase family protein [Bacillota bacterium]